MIDNEDDNAPERSAEKVELPLLLPGEGEEDPVVQSVDAVPWRTQEQEMGHDPVPLAQGMLQGEEVPEDAEEQATELVLGVKFREYGPVYFFLAGPHKIRQGEKVLVEVEYGKSLAEVVTVRRMRSPVPPLRMPDGGEIPIKPIFGPAGAQDIAAAADNHILASSARMFCRECIRERNLDMKLVDVEVLHDRSKIIFYFTAPSRIDFRELVKDLVRNYRTRIELRQIGVRHETQMLGALGNCGMACCCRRYLRRFAPVTIKMAKEQNLFLNPAKLSGICGRLLCCLSYEQANYEEFHRRSPKLGKKYQTSQGVLKVLRANLFRQSIFAQNEAGEEQEFSLDDWQALNPQRLENSPQQDPPQVAEAAQAPRNRHKTGRESFNKHRAALAAQNRDRQDSAPEDPLQENNNRETTDKSSGGATPVDFQPDELESGDEDAQQGQESIFGLPGAPQNRPDQSRGDQARKPRNRRSRRRPGK